MRKLLIQRTNIRSNQFDRVCGVVAIDRGSGVVEGGTTPAQGWYHPSDRPGVVGGGGGCGCGWRWAVGWTPTTPRQGPPPLVVLGWCGRSHAVRALWVFCHNKMQGWYHPTPRVVPPQLIAQISLPELPYCTRSSVRAHVALLSYLRIYRIFEN